MKSNIGSKSNRRLLAAATMFPDLLSADDLEALDSLQGNKKKKRKTIRDFTAEDIILRNAVTDDFDIKALMNSAEDPVTGTLRDLRVDDRDLALAKNFYDFSFNIIGRDSNPPWARQLWTGAMLFGEVCPTCSDPKWLDIHNVPKTYRSEDMPEHLQFLNHGICPKCKATKYDLIQLNKIKNYQELVLVWGQRSGKSESAAFFSTYITHRFMKFPKMSTLTRNLQASTPLTATFVSLTFTKAVSLLWTPFFNKINSSKWFNEYHQMLDFYGNKYGQELYRKKDLFIKYHHKGLHLYPSHPNGPILRGDTRFLAVIDELALFAPAPKKENDETQSERANADEAHKSLTNSLTTIQALSIELMKSGKNSVPNAIMMGVSSPMSERDKVMRLLRASRTGISANYMLGIQLPTWEVNPSIEKSTPVIALAYESNPEKAERDFGANPPKVHSTFIKRNMVEEGVYIGTPNSHKILHQFDLPGEIYGSLVRLYSIPFPSIMSLDAGEVNNAFAITVTYYNFDTGKTVVSTMLEVVPQEGRRINFNKVYKEIILPLAIDSNCILVLADRWNSLDLLHRIKEDRGIIPNTSKPVTASKQYSVKRRDFDVVLDLAKNKNLVLPRFNKEDQERVLEGRIDNWRVELLNKPVAHSMLQMLTVKDVGDTRPPEKGEGYTDDLFRALVLGASKIHEPKVMEALLAAKVTAKVSRGMPMPGFAGRSGGLYGRAFR